MTPISRILATFPRIAIAGGPGSGKTTLASVVDDRSVVHTDDYMGEEWSEVPSLVIGACDSDRFVVEGVQVPRSLRRGLEVDAVVWLPGAKKTLNKRQDGMRRAVKTVMKEWLAMNAVERKILVVTPCPCSGGMLRVDSGCPKCKGLGYRRITG